jgi:hypothetical protein
MSRGRGQLQTMIYDVIGQAEKPLTFDEIIGVLLQEAGVNDPTARLRPDRERAYRRAIKGLCDRDLISTVGSGRPGDPYRYSFDCECALCRKVIPDGEPAITHENGRRLCLGCASGASANISII